MLTIVLFLGGWYLAFTIGVHLGFRAYKTPEPPAKAAVPPACFHISHIMLLCPGKAVPCVRVFGDTQDDLIAGLLLAAREDQ